MFSSSLSQLINSSYYDYSMLLSCYSLLSLNFLFEINYFYFFISFLFLFFLFCNLYVLIFLFINDWKIIHLMFMFYLYQNLFAYHYYIKPDITKAIPCQEGVEKYRNLIFDCIGEQIYNCEDFNVVYWWEPWSYEVMPFFPPFSKKFFNSPWHFYYKFRLSTWLRWHVLEDRICIFVLFFIWLLL